MRERPILFSGPMVRAILDGRKTQTRRVVKGMALDWLQPENFTPEYVAQHSGLCPYGQVGDHLYVRETWGPTHGSVSYEYGEHSVFEWDPERHGPLEKGARGLEIYYRADGEDALPAEFSMAHGSEIRWRPSIHMPRWASRLSLRITDVRVERLQHITEADAKAEGLALPGLILDGHAAGCFGRLWDSINGERPGCSWDANPWVWAISFERVQP